MAWIQSCCSHKIHLPTFLIQPYFLCGALEEKIISPMMAMTRNSCNREELETHSQFSNFPPQKKAMKQSERVQTSIPDDIAFKIASLLQVSDVCALGSCCRLWRELWGSDSIWESLAKERWPSLTLFHASSSSSTVINAPISKGWKDFYIKRHKEVAGNANAVAKFVELCSQTESLEVGDHLKAIEDLSTTQLGFKDVQMFLFKPKCNVLLNLVGLHYCIHWLGVPGEYVIEALQSCKISERQVCVKWWKLGRWFYGFRMRDESYSRWVSLADLAMAKEPEVLVVLQRGAIHEVLRVQISVANPTCTPWSCQSTQTQN